ncbi:suppressor of temperature_sensitive growth [Enterospora canceri]|uniref:Mediator of RNA polymerase II transcription subunit 31 n=1 Tax=Enterospora canceri TaxID=1081671 RepID=A0A1Y1S9L8_9MICR|nr:suppressor of temperature_sensitive growth [Enterospora canceri]
MKTNFERDLEFVQMLCNPEYLRWLYNGDWFRKEEFRLYLRRLRYFGSPKFRVFLHYPQCMAVLERIIEDESTLEKESFYEQLEKQQFFIWKNS